VSCTLTMNYTMKTSLQQQESFVIRVGLSLCVKLNNFWCSYCVVTGCTQDRKEAQQQQHFVCYFHSWWMMTVRVLNRFMYYTRMGHYIGACRIIDRFRQRTAGVNGALLQAYGVDLCRSKNGDYHSSGSTAERSSYNTSRFALATGVVFVLGSAG